MDFFIVLSFVVLIVNSSPFPLAERQFFGEPVITTNFPDPGLIEVNGAYYVFSTNNGKYNVPMARSSNFETWTVSSQDALPTIPSWSMGAIWAPDPVRLVSQGYFVQHSQPSVLADVNF